MASTEIKKLDRFPLFLYLLPLFFVFHGFSQYYFLVPVRDSLLLLLKYLVATAVLNLLFYFLFRNNRKASLYVFVLLAINFFFGAFHDFLKKQLPGSFFAKYAFVLPLVLIGVIVFFILVWRMKKTNMAFRYLNLLFGLLTLLDMVLLAVKIPGYDRQHQVKSINAEFTYCDTCARPDVYLIVADEYAGEKTLHDLYNYDNSSFLGQLKDRHFQVIPKSISNYNITPISIASILNINPIHYAGKDLSDIAMVPVYNLIDTNILVPFFRFHGYDFINNSIFTVYGEPPLAIQSFTPVNTRIIESQTLINRLMRDLGYHLVEWHILKHSVEDDYTVRDNNEKIIRNLKEQSSRRSGRPIFSYSHITMPHAPYYYDRNGKPYPNSDIVEGSQWLDQHYLEYLTYTNKVLIDLLDYILHHSAKPPVIILVSDHGFRHYSKNVHEEYDFYNLNATYLPSRYQIEFREGLSNVSYMRTLLNLLFNQHLAVDKQSQYYIPIPIRHNIKNE